MKGKRGRGRPRQNLMDWMMEDGSGNSRKRVESWTFGHAGRHMT